MLLYQMTSQKASCSCRHNLCHIGTVPHIVATIFQCTRCTLLPEEHVSKLLRPMNRKETSGETPNWKWFFFENSLENRCVLYKYVSYINLCLIQILILYTNK